MVNWPATLPQDFLRESFVRTPRSRLLAFATDAGPGKVRRRSTARTKSHQGALQLTLEQARMFEEFFEETLQDGAMPFGWTDPVTGDFASWRFDTSDPYSLRELAEDLWALSISIVRLP